MAPWGVMLPNFNPFGLDPWPYLDVVRAVEDHNFDAGWVGDHLAFPPPIIEATAALAAAAAVTGCLRLRWLGAPGKLSLAQYAELS